MCVASNEVDLAEFPYDKLLNSIFSEMSTLLFERWELLDFEDEFGQTYRQELSVKVSFLEVGPIDFA
jgi:hypothetical protein